MLSSLVNQDQTKQQQKKQQKNIFFKSRVRKTQNLSTDAGSITDTFFVGVDKGADTVTVTVTVTLKLLVSYY